MIRGSLVLLVGTVAAFVLAAAGLLLVQGAWESFALLKSGDAEAVGACVSTPDLDCNSTHWRRGMIVGGALLGAAASIGAVVWRMQPASGLQCEELHETINS